MSVSSVESVVSTYAGATLTISTNSSANAGAFDLATDAITDAEPSATIVRTRIFTADGAEVPTYAKGLNIVRVTLSNGQTITKKVLMR